MGHNVRQLQEEGTEQDVEKKNGDLLPSYHKIQQNVFAKISLTILKIYLDLNNITFLLLIFSNFHFVNCKLHFFLHHICTFTTSEFLSGVVIFITTVTI